MELKLNSKEEIEKYLNEPIPKIDIKEKIKQIKLERKINEKYEEEKTIKNLVFIIEKASERISIKKNKEKIIKAIEILEGRE